MAKLILVLLLITSLNNVQGWDVEVTPIECKNSSFMVRLTDDDFDESNIIVGIVITLNHIITTASGLYLATNQPLFVLYYGDKNHTNIDVNITSINYHPQYNKNTMINDIALIETEKIKFYGYKKKIHPIAIANSLPGSNETISIMVYYNGYYRAEVQTFDTATCNSTDHYNGGLITGLLCAEHFEYGINFVVPCDQLSYGSPVIYNSKLIGLLSEQTVCDSYNSKEIIVYTDITQFREWIDTFIAKNVPSLRISAATSSYCNLIVLYSVIVLVMMRSWTIYS